MKVIIDTNVLLVANGQHHEVSPECVMACIERLQAIDQAGVTVIDDGYRILGEYLHKTSLSPPKGAGDVFLKSLLRRVGNADRVEQVALTETTEHHFLEFPDAELEPQFDAPDRKFVAVAHAHPGRPPVLQAADSKWLDWWPTLAAHGVRVEFLCPEDACGFYRGKFPGKPLPALPAES